MAKKSFLAQVKEERKQRLNSAIKKRKREEREAVAEGEEHSEKLKPNMAKKKKKEMALLKREEERLSSSSVYDELAKDDVPRRKSRPDNFQRAKAIYERLQTEKAEAAVRRREERERRERAAQEYLSTKKKMEKALRKSTRKGQPNLSAQVEVLLEKIQKRMN